MADKPGDIFTDKRGHSYELRPDPKDGHLRPVTIGKGGSSGSILGDIISAIIVSVVFTAASEGFRWIGEKIKGRRK